MQCTSVLVFYLLAFSLSGIFIECQDWPNYDFVVREAAYRRLCKAKKILTVNGEFPGPTIYVHRGDIITVTIYNQGRDNITIHWHGVKQPRNPWSDGPEYITQCPIQPGKVHRQKVIFSTEEGTLWWHAHSDWSRATVYGAIVIYPKLGATYPFAQPYQEVPIILGEWWKTDVRKVLKEALLTGRNPTTSDAFTINGQPGDLYNCSNRGTFNLSIEHDRTYLLRIINAAMNHILFIAISSHNLTAIGADGSYVKPFTKEYMVLGPGQTLDCLLHANQESGEYYMAASPYSTGVHVEFDQSITTAIVKYIGNYSKYIAPWLPYLPSFTDTAAAFDVLGQFRSLASQDHPIFIPINNMRTKLIFAISINAFPCLNNLCLGPNGTRLAASINNISFIYPNVDLLQAYYYKTSEALVGEITPSDPPVLYNYTAEYQDLALELTRKGTSVKYLEYNSDVEIVFQGTSLVAGLDHPMHLHGYSFYVVGWGFGNFDKDKDPLTYNLVDPPLRNTVVVPKNGWAAVRFKADNPGVWFLHCHIERHQTWGMDVALVVMDGNQDEAKMLPPPLGMPPC
ncbi:laccase-15-like [Apium graveolens]|uniref:laccase-15-like n=1 Tax=Apium graveolens TaxID=4045 RepID=UPI003D79ECF1